MRSAVDTWSLNHWITREVPIKLILKKKKIPNKKRNTCWWTLNQASMLNTEAHREITALLNSLILLPAPEITIVKILMWFFPKPSLYLFFWLCHEASGILISKPGIEPSAPALEVRNLNHWVAKEFSILAFKLFRSRPNPYFLIIQKVQTSLWF